MKIQVLVRSIKSSILSLTSSSWNDTFWGLRSAAVKQSRCRFNMAAKGDRKFGPLAEPRIFPNQKIDYSKVDATYQACRSFFRYTMLLASVSEACSTFKFRSLDVAPKLPYFLFPIRPSNSRFISSLTSKHKTSGCSYANALLE